MHNIGCGLCGVRPGLRIARVEGTSYVSKAQSSLDGSPANGQARTPDLSRRSWRRREVLRLREDGHMTKSRVGLGIVAVCVLAVLGIGALLVWPLALNPATGAAIASVSTAFSAAVGLIAAAASAVAAVAAMRAAQQSDQTATRAIEALGFATAPKLKIVAANESVQPDVEASGANRVVLLWNTARWTATDLEVQLHSQDGHVDSVHLGKLEHSEERPDGSPYQPSQIAFPMRRPLGVGDASWRGEAAWEDSVVVHYSDERGLLRWRVAFPLRYTMYRNETMAGGSTGPGEGWGKEKMVPLGR
jgi:hypothetical protein